MNYISTWLYIESKDDESYYPQVGGTSSDINIQKIYWKCVFDFFHSSLKFNRDKKHLFFTNIDIKNMRVLDIDLEEFFYDNNIDVIKIELTNKTPKDWFGEWRNQLYIFDILEYIKQNYNDSCKFVILDSDCIFTKNIDCIYNDINKYKNLCLNLNYDSNHRINGLTEVDMAQIYNKVFDANEEIVKYYGGEFFAADYKSICDIVMIFNRLWNENFQLYKGKQYKLNEEAHFFSCIYKFLNINNDYGNKFIKRMWTSYRYNNIDKSDECLAIWHLPAEKRTGFIYLFDEIYKDYKAYWNISDDDYRIILKKNLGIPKKNTLKKFKDAKNLILRKIKKLL